MSLYAIGIPLDKACVLLALDTMFGDDVDWGKDFLLDYFSDYSDVGFSYEHFYLIEESAPVVRIKNNTVSVSSDQSDPYVYIYGRDTGIRYRVLRDAYVMLVYDRGDNILHATAIPAREITAYGHKYTLATVFLQKYGTIVDQRTYEDDNRG
jgi:hypothetical protein